MKYSMTCNCGDVMTIEAGSRAEAVKSLRAELNEKAVAEHMKTKHPGEAVPTRDQIYAMIEKDLKTAA